MPMPAAMRISVVLTGGGRFAPKGILTKNDHRRATPRSPFRESRSLPTTPGSMLRIDHDPTSPGASTTEWIGYTNYSGGKVTTTTQLRGARRTAKSTHEKGDVVRIGVTYSLVRSLPR